MNYAIIGMGFIFSRHIQAVQDIGGKIIATCDLDLAKNPDFTDYREMLASPIMKDVDAIVICTPNHLHKQMIKDSLAINKRVLCEKPLIIDDDFTGLEDVNVVLQLRYHKMIPDIQKTLTHRNNIKLIMKVYRDEKWWQSWRGDESKSGGILMGIAIHMFDLLIFLLGNDYRILRTVNSRKKCTGVISYLDSLIEYDVEILDSRRGQTRKLIINGKEFELCDKDNLSFAGYHDIVHREFQKGNGIPLTEAKKSIELVLKLKNNDYK